eukprot:TRINITY_DN4449_c0_g1_i1.p1 TRINITY_DN4449_c0_g1~~TRINITY_DN4449_c0_g1_i1.p1  ORF type:complete len:263 (-),score=106.99 TRINITY_DN4449_c0_g1_i1:265-1053(-)
MGAAQGKEMTHQQREAILKQLNGKFSTQEINHLLGVFKGKSSIKKPEFKAGIKQIYVRFQNPCFSEECSDAVFEMFDKDHSGTVEISEIATGLIALSSSEPAERIELAFSSFDINGDGSVSKKELQTKVKQLLKICCSVAEKEAVSNLEKGKKDWEVLMEFSPILDSLAEFLQKSLVESILKSADSNQDGSISKEEWSQAASDPNVAKLMDPYASTHLFKGFYKEVAELEKNKTPHDQILQALIDKAGLKVSVDEVKNKKKK